MRDYQIFIDENLPPQIARALNILQEPQNARDKMTVTVRSIKDEYGEGALDEEWIPQVGALGGVVITQDYRIQSLKHQRELYKEKGVGILFFSPPSSGGFGYWEMVKQVVNRREDIKQIVKKHKPPFAFRCSARTKFESLED